MASINTPLSYLYKVMPIGDGFGTDISFGKKYFVLLILVKRSFLKMVL